MNLEVDTISRIILKREMIDAVIDRIISDCEDNHVERDFGQGDWRDMIFTELASMLELPFVEIDPDDPEFGSRPDENDPRVQELRRQFDDFAGLEKILENSRTTENV